MFVFIYTIRFFLDQLACSTLQLQAHLLTVTMTSQPSERICVRITLRELSSDRVDDFPRACFEQAQQTARLLPLRF